MKKLLIILMLLTSTAYASSGQKYAHEPSKLDDEISNIYFEISKLVSSNASNTLSAGSLIAYAGATPPDGYLNCNGAAVSRTTYADLFTAIGTTWGTGDGSTTFNVPDLRGRTLISSGTGSGLTNRTLGTQNIGEETHVLTIPELASHSHTQDAHSHAGVPVVSTTHGAAGADIDVNAFVNDATGSSNNSTATNQSTGSGTAHNVMQPSAVVNYIIKT